MPISFPHLPKISSIFFFSLPSPSLSLLQNPSFWIRVTAPFLPQIPLTKTRRYNNFINQSQKASCTSISIPHQSSQSHVTSLYSLLIIIIITITIISISISSYTKEALDLNAKLVENNPEWHTAWKYRKLVVESFLSRLESDPDYVKSILDEELRVVTFLLGFS
ncbi:unnamed protein product [Lupinus luteus]|uniref:Uncharacterized protein n=1 Tax=Lupinus luteus TaxID=3873 RepID=A0AAV1X1A3_LUPLU